MRRAGAGSPAEPQVEKWLAETAKNAEIPIGKPCLHFERGLHVAGQPT
jgi:hypothetical protein